MTIKGEYWYSNDNKLYACDGDRNKFGHEGFLIYYSRKILKSAIEKKYKKKDKWGDPVKISLVNQWGSMDDSDDFKWELIEYSDEDLNPYNEDSISKLISELNKPIIDNDFFKVCFSDEYSSGEIDVVEYGIQRLKWIRIVGRDARGGIVKDIQVPELNRDYLKKTYNAIIAACYKEKKQ
jgi:hypothetical protein